MAAGCSEAILHDLRAVLRFGDPRARADRRDLRQPHPPFDPRERAPTMGNLPRRHVTPASEPDRAQVEELCEAVRRVTGESVELVSVDQGYTGEEAFDTAAGRWILPDVVKLGEAKQGFVLPPRRRVVERSFGWASRLRRRARDYGRLTETLAGFHSVAFSLPMARKAAPSFA